jgi:hypothetical protein
LVGCSEATLVLAEVFFPGGNAEDLDELVRSFAVSVQLPTGRSDAEKERERDQLHACLLMGSPRSTGGEDLLPRSGYP